MRVGVIQSNYIPWRGYFDFINSVDLFVFHDDIQYTKQDWRNRNKIKMWPQGSVWITIPVKYDKTDQLICDTKIDYSTNWQAEHLNRFRAGYDKTPFYEQARGLLAEGLMHRDETISQLNIRLIRSICGYFDIKTPFVHSQTLNLQGTKTERLLDLLKKTGATSYLTGPKAKAYLDEDLLRRNNIEVEYKTYNYPQYPQPWGAFDGTVTVLDVVANCGSNLFFMENVEVDENCNPVRR
jgi:hypothetical protein